MPAIATYRIATGPHAAQGPRARSASVCMHQLSITAPRIANRGGRRRCEAHAPSNACAATSPARALANASAMTAGRSCIDSSTTRDEPHVVPTPPIHAALRVPHPIGAASGDAAILPIWRPASPPPTCRRYASSLCPTPRRPSHPIPRRVRPELQAPTALSPTLPTNPRASSVEAGVVNSASAFPGDAPRSMARLRPRRSRASNRGHFRDARAPGGNSPSHPPNGPGRTGRDRAPSPSTYTPGKRASGIRRERRLAMTDTAPIRARAAVSGAAYRPSHRGRTAGPRRRPRAGSSPAAGPSISRATEPGLVAVS